MLVAASKDCNKYDEALGLSMRQGCTSMCIFAVDAPVGRGSLCIGPVTRKEVPLTMGLTQPVHNSQTCCAKQAAKLFGQEQQYSSLLNSSLSICVQTKIVCR